GFSSPQDRVKAEPAGASIGDVEKEKAEKDRALASIQNRPKAARRMDREVGHSHFAASNERCDGRKEPQRDKATAEEFDDASYKPPELMQFLLAPEYAEQLLRAVASE